MDALCLSLFFNAAKQGSLNIHFSLLPRHRGAGPVQWSLLKGDQETGVTAFWIEEGMDSGPIFDREKISIDEEDNAKTLRSKLIPLGVDLLKKVISQIKNGKVVKTPQEGEPSHAPLIKKEQGKIDWTKPATSIVNLIRGLYEWPGAATKYTLAGGSPKQLKIYKAKVDSSPKKGNSGEILEERKNEGFLVQAGDSPLLIQKVQPEGKKVMTAWAFWMGAHLKVGDRLRI